MRLVHTNKLARLGLFLSAALLPSMATAQPPGLSSQALDQLSAAGVDKYLGEFTPISSQDVGDGWVKHTFDSDGGNGPICIAGTPYSVFTREGQNPDHLLIMLQGGGACWQDFYFCNILASSKEPPFPPAGIWDFDSKDNPFRNYSVVYMPYCDGSVFSGDNDVVDANFPFGPVRFHRGLRNVSAGMDIAEATFPDAARITIAGSSAGGVGAAAFTPFLARFLYGNTVQNLRVFNDAGPIVVNLAAVGDVLARASDWQFGQFYPASCTDCSVFGQQTAIIDWRLDNDSTIREAFYETDGDATNRFFTKVPTQALYRALILSEHGALNAAHPDRYKRFIVSGDDSHTAMQSPLFYSQDADGVPLNEWTGDFLIPRPFWVDIVEDFVPVP
jgi:hypothetical protein